MLGAALALLRQSRGAVSRSPLITDVLLSIGLCLIVGPVFLYDAFTPFPGFAALVPCIGTALVIWFGDQRSRVGATPHQSADGFHRRIVLFAVPVALAPHRVRQHAAQPRAGPLTATQMLVVLVATFTCAWLSFVLIENPIRRRTLLPTRRRLFATMGIGAARWGFVGLIAVVGQGLQYRLPEAALRIADAARTERPTGNAARKTSIGTSRQTTCVILGRRTAQPRFLLWGDSHALALFPAVDAAAKETGVVGLHASLHQCPPVPGIDTNVPGIDCSGFNRRISHLIDSERLRRRHPRRVLVDLP